MAAGKKAEKIQQIDISKLHPFEGHPFKVTDDELMARTAESIRDFGITTPLLVRPDRDGGYEIVSGHRRHHAAEIAGMKSVPCIVREMDDDTAVITMVDSNLQRETLLPSERAFAYKMKMDAIKHQGQRTDLTSDQVGPKLTAAEKIADAAGDSQTQVKRFIRLTNLIPELMDKVDSKEIAFSPAVELSFLSEEEQCGFMDAMEYGQTAPSLSQAQRIRKLSQSGECTREAMNAIMDEEKKSPMDNLTLKSDVLRRFFPKSFTPKQMEDTIIRLLEQWQKRRQRDQSR